jgi:hypothetical protein
VHSLKIADVAVAVRQQHVQSHVVDDGTIEVNRCERKDRPDLVRRAERLVVKKVANHALAAA